MTDKISFPPLHDLPPGELQRRKEHLLSEIRRPRKPVWVSLQPFIALQGRRSLLAVRPLLVGLVVVTALALVPIGGASLGTRAVDGIAGAFEQPANQPSLDAAADDAESVAGSAYYTGTRVDDNANAVDVYLSHAPQSIIDQLQAMHPGTYVISNDAAHPLSELLKVEHALKLGPLDSTNGSIEVMTAYPTSDGYLKVGVARNSDVPTAQSKLDSQFGAGVIEVFGGAQPLSAGSGQLVPAGGSG
jgi:hypothetical protein